MPNAFRKHFVTPVKLTSPSEIRPSVYFQARPVVSNIAILQGTFETDGRSPFDDPFVEEAIKKGLTAGLADLPGWHEPRIQRIFQLASIAHDVRQWVHPGLDPFDPLHVPWPVHQGLTSGQSRCLLCVGLGSAASVFGNNSAISRNALDDFLSLEAPEDCREFAKRWGLLGDWQAGVRSYVLSDPSDAEVRTAVAQKLHEQGILREGSVTLERGLQGSVYGEPLDAWLWHVSRLRTWGILLRTSNLRRQLNILNRPVEFLKLPMPGHSPTEGIFMEGWHVPHLRPDVTRPADTDDVDAIKNAKAWDYAVHQEGGFMRFAHQRFGLLRELSQEPLDARFVNELVKLIRGLLQETLAGKVSFQPFSSDGFATVEPNSLLAWLYLEFANRHAEILGGTVSSSPCANPGCQKLAIWHGIGRPKEYCDKSCKSAAWKKRNKSKSSRV